MVNGRKFRIFACAMMAGVVVGGLALFMTRDTPLMTRLQDGRIVPPWGIKLNPNSTDLGDIESTEKKFARIYQAIIAFRDAQGRLPYAGNELLEWSEKEGRDLIDPEMLKSADVHLTDEYAQGFRDHLEFRFDLRATRPDGTAKPAFPKEGERDVWVTSVDHVRQNEVLYPSKSVMRSPQGFYVVLWSDGAVERVPVGDRIWVNGSSGLTATFEGQAGIGKGATKRESEMHRFGSAVPEGFIKGGGPG